MIEPSQHEARSSVHRRAILAGSQITRKVELDPNTTLIEYARIKGCYAYFGATRGCFRILLSLDEVLQMWPDEEKSIPMSRVGNVAMG